MRTRAKSTCITLMTFVAAIDILIIAMVSPITHTAIVATILIWYECFV